MHDDGIFCREWISYRPILVMKQKNEKYNLELETYYAYALGIIVRAIQRKKPDFLMCTYEKRTNNALTKNRNQID